MESLQVVKGVSWRECRRQPRWCRVLSGSARNKTGRRDDLGRHGGVLRRDSSSDSQRLHTL